MGPHEACFLVPQLLGITSVFHDVCLDSQISGRAMALPALPVSPALISSS